MPRRWTAFIVVMALVCVASLVTIGASLLDALDPGCPRGSEKQLRRGLAVVEAGLPPGAVAEEFPDGCSSGDGPLLVLHLRGETDPVEALLASGSGWSRVPPEPSDPEHRGSTAMHAFEGKDLVVGSMPYPQSEHPEPGVRWAGAVSIN